LSPASVSGGVGGSETPSPTSFRPSERTDGGGGAAESPSPSLFATPNSLGTPAAASAGGSVVTAKLAAAKKPTHGQKKRRRRGRALDKYNKNDLARGCLQMVIQQVSLL